MIVDVHTHVVPDRFPDPVGAEPAWPTMRHGADGAAEILISGRVFRTVDRRSFDVDARLADMDRDGIDVQVLSPMPELLSYWFAPDAAAALAEGVNGHIAAMVARAPDRFRGFAMVPLQEPARAAAAVEVLAAQGFAGVEVGSHVAGTPLGDPSLEPFFAAAERVGLTVMVHALHPAGTERIGGAPDMAAAAVFPLETALAATSLLAGGVLERHPALRVLLCHGGGALPAILPRLDHAWRCGLSLARTMSSVPSEQAARFFCDSIVYGGEALALAVRAFGAEHVVVGSDYPFAVMQTDPAGFVRRAAPADAEAIMRAGAALLGAAPAMARENGSDAFV